MMVEGEQNRRPVRSRSSKLAQRGAVLLAAAGISPNQISVTSVVFACTGAFFLLWLPGPAGLIGCAPSIQGRLACNLLHGMVAIEGGKKSSVGQLYNEFPDRVADSVLIDALGYAIELPALGWFGALAAALTAYVRIFGGSLGLPQDFRGPMAKQHRMAVMTVACLAGALENVMAGTNYALIAAAVVIAIGSVLTCITRTAAMAAQLKEH